MKYNDLIIKIYLASLITLINNVSNNGLTNVIIVGENYCKYIDFASFSNGDLILLSSSNPGNLKRYFYGIKKDGREFFDDSSFNNTLEVSNEETSDNYTNYRFESDIFVATINDGPNKGKEYLISIPKDQQFIELYNFEEKKVNKIKAISLLDKEVKSIRGTAFSFDLNETYYTFFGFLSTQSSTDIIFKRLSFNSLELSKETTEILTYTYSDRIVPTLSCYITKLKYIVCSSLLQSSSSSSKLLAYAVRIFVLDENLAEKFSINIPLSYNDDVDSFIKCIHLKDEVGVFAFYLHNSYLSYYPVLLFKNYNVSKMN